MQQTENIRLSINTDTKEITATVEFIHYSEWKKEKKKLPKITATSKNISVIYKDLENQLKAFNSCYYWQDILFNVQKVIIRNRNTIN